MPKCVQCGTETGFIGSLTFNKQTGRCGRCESEVKQFLMRVQVQSGGIYLELSRKTGNGFYSASDPLLLEAVIDTIVRMTKRQLVGLNSDNSSRHIPQDVRYTVWQRDQGKCVECGVGGPGAYLEFDHVIPYSKGGASTIGNVQLLCRRCNLRKGDRI